MDIETSLMIISITQLFLAIAIVFVSLTQRDIRMFIRRLSAGIQDLINARGAQELGYLFLAGMSWRILATCLAGLTQMSTRELTSSDMISASS